MTLRFERNRIHMKVFISWSGPTSHQVAMAFKDWLPLVIQSIEPYVSSGDIDKGARWSLDIASELEDSNFGLVCVTPTNPHAPWLNFEAGALSKSIDKGRVCPFLFKVKQSDIDGPLLQFQSTVYKKEEVFKLLESMNKVCEQGSLDDGRLDTMFKTLWPKLDKALSAIQVENDVNHEEDDQPEDFKEYTTKVLEEVLEISRTNQKLLRDPDVILTASEFRTALEKSELQRQAEKMNAATSRLVNQKLSWDYSLRLYEKIKSRTKPITIDEINRENIETGDLLIPTIQHIVDALGELQSMGYITQERTPDGGPGFWVPQKNEKDVL